ncbi:hypothetical protein, partial [Streptococcus suis]|uniref:hypothetical protein n=1 Tax=Streptococcus suis TaxID=1307 RepID=UPI001EE6A59C
TNKKSGHFDRFFYLWLSGNFSFILSLMKVNTAVCEKMRIKKYADKVIRGIFSLVCSNIKKQTSTNIINIIN